MATGKRKTSKKRMSRRRQTSKYMLNRSLSSISKSSRKVIPGVKHGVEGVGKTVTGVVEKSVPAAQSGLKQFFSMFKFGKTKKNRKSRKY